MKTFKVLLNSMEKAQRFVKVLSQYNGNLDIAVGRYVVDARSIMGIMSIDLTRVLEFRVEESHPKLVEIENVISEFIVG